MFRMTSTIHVGPDCRYCQPAAAQLPSRFLRKRAMKSERHPISTTTLVLLASVSLAGCIGENFQRGYVPSATALQQVTVGAPREQVLIVLGTPSTTADLGGEVFYYISQTTNRPVRFMNSRVIDQK